MAILHTAANMQHLEAEAQVVHKTNKEAAWQEQDAKKRTRLIVIHSLLILISIGIVLYVLLCPGILSNILATVKETLNGWRERLSDYILMPESAERPENTIGMIWLGILLALDWVLRMLGKVLLFVLVWTSPVLIVGGMILIAFLIVRYSCIAIGDNWGRKQKKDEIKDSVIQSLDKDVARDYDNGQSVQNALTVLSELSDECHIFTNLNITTNAETCKYGMVVVSPSGVTVVDVKSNSGLLFGDLSEQNLYPWEHQKPKTHKEKKKEKNDPEKKMPNPVKAMGVQVHKLAHYLKEQKIPVFVQGCVLFADEKLQLHITDHNGLGKNCPLFLINDPALLDYVHSAARSALSPTTIQQIVAALKEENHG